MPSVTEVLKVMERRHLETWRARVGRKEADKVRTAATTLGTQVHAIANQIAWERESGAKAKVKPDLELYALAIRSFLLKHVRCPIKTELTLVSAQERVGGTLDLYCQLNDGSFAVVDYKTSASLDRTMGLQTALYALLLRERGYEVNQRLVVRIKKDAPGQFYVRIYDDHAGDVRAARACVELWHWQYGQRLLKALEVA